MKTRDFDNGFPAWFIVAWVFCAAVSIATIAIVLWAIIRLVGHYT